MVEAVPSCISVVMVTYHTGDVLFQAISSVLAQDVPLELCLVDNGNPPEILEKIRALAVIEPRLKLITGHGNVGFGTACNMGVKAGRGDYVLLLNPDGILPAHALKKLMKHGGGLRSPYMIGARLLDDDGRDQRGCRRALLTPKTALVEALHLQRFFPEDRLNFNENSVPDVLTPMPAISGAFMFVPRADYDRIGGFDEGYFLHVEDLDICLRFRRAGGEIYFAPDVVVTHVGGTSQATKPFIEMNKARGFIRYFHNNFSGMYPKILLWALDAAIWVRTGLVIVKSKVS